MKAIHVLIFLSFASFSIKAQTLKVMSYNIHHGADASETDHLADMAKLIKQSGAELVGLQEVDSMCNRSGKVDQMKKLAELTGMHYAFARHFSYDGGAYGQGILSKYKIENSENIRITLLKKGGVNETRALLKSEILLPKNKKLIFASVHCALDAASREIQAKEILAALKSEGNPVILTGDFNSLPDSPDIKILETWFQTADNRHLPTFPAIKPVKTIDYIFTARKFLRRIKSYQVFDQIGYSDHAPIIAVINMKVD